MVIRPLVEVNAIEGDAVCADGDGDEERAHFVVEAVFVHAEVGRGVAEAD